MSRKRTIVSRRNTTPTRTKILVRKRGSQKRNPPTSFYRILRRRRRGTATVQQPLTRVQVSTPVIVEVTLSLVQLAAPEGLSQASRLAVALGLTLILKTFLVRLLGEVAEAVGVVDSHRFKRRFWLVRILKFRPISHSWTLRKALRKKYQSLRWCLVGLAKGMG